MVQGLSLLYLLTFVEGPLTLGYGLYNTLLNVNGITHIAPEEILMENVKKPGQSKFMPGSFAEIFSFLSGRPVNYVKLCSAMVSKQFEKN